MHLRVATDKNKFVVLYISENMPKKEEPLYEPIMNALKEVFDHFGYCYLEKTADKRFSNRLKRQFSKDTLYINRVEGFFPDLTGFVKTQSTVDLITVEVKATSPTIKNIFQAKQQAEIFEAKYALIISPKVIPEEKRRFVKDRSSILNYSYNRQLVIAQFNTQSVVARLNGTVNQFDVDKELYYGSLPEPFRTAYKPVLYFFDPKASKENIIGNRVVVKGKNTYLVPEWVDDLVRKGQFDCTHIEVADGAGFYKHWLRTNGFLMFQRSPTKEELGV